MRILALASILLLSWAASAEAAVRSEVEGSTLTVKGDEGPDPIALTVLEGNIAVNGAVTIPALAADGNAEIAVESGGGADTVDAHELVAGTYGSLVVEGGEGNDKIDGGGTDGDVLSGDGGADELTGGKGSDVIFGGEGDDLMIWNNGDGTDEDTGGEGDDRLETNGNPAAEAYTYRRGERADWVLLSRAAGGVGNGPFSIEVISADLVVNGLAGNDSFEATTPPQSATPGLAGLTLLTVNGGAGDDTIRGGDGDDVLNGDEGTDRLAGREGVDAVDAGGGNDEIFWSEGDGDEEEVIGGPGQFDRLVVTGSETADDEFELVAGPTSRVERTNPTPLTINLPDGQGEVEEVSINPGGGDDIFIASTGLPGMLIQADGGPGDDVIIGGDGPDQLFGGEDDDRIIGGPEGDVLFGEAGNDLIDGGDGNELIKGGDGNDTLIGDRGQDGVFGELGDDAIHWSDSDEDDGVLLGEAGVDRLVVSVSDTGGDELELRPGTLERTNLTPFTLTLPVGGEAFEEVTVATRAGNDTLVVSPGLGGLVLADGGPGSDSLLGSEESDTFSGGSGADLLDGSGGSDRLLARDQEADVVHGGAGDDRAQTDALTLDVVDGVERIDEAPPLPPNEPPQPPQVQPPGPVPPPTPPAADRVALLPKLGKVAVAASGKKLVAKVPVSCPAAESGGCRTTLTLRTAKARPGMVIGSKTVRLAPGGRTTAPIRITPGAAKLTVNGKLAARLQIATTDAAGNNATATVAVILRLPR
jgi:Ca2+-binding RTX toxin-like protein